MPRGLNLRTPLIIIGTVLLVFLSVMQSLSTSWFEMRAAGPLQRPPAVPVQQIAFELHDSLIFIPVQVNGSSTMWFILDSGSDSIVINARQVAALGLKREGRGTATGWSNGRGAGGDRISFVRGAAVGLSSVEFRNQTLVVASFEQLEGIAGRPIDGVLGSEVFTRFVVAIDYTKQIVSLFEPRNYSYVGNGTLVPLTIKKNLPGVMATVGLSNGHSVSGQLIVDTGADNALFLFAPYVRKHIPSVSDSGVVASLQVGSYVLKNPVTAVSDASKGFEATKQWAGQIGGRILTRFNLVFDYSRKVMFLKPNGELGRTGL